MKNKIRNKVVVFPDERVIDKIYLISNQRVMLDLDLAELYGVETKHLKRAVKRNKERFPADFMFVVSGQDLENLRCQIGTSSWGGVRYSPMAFTEQGVAMISSVLNSKRAIAVNIQIIRVFTRMRHILTKHKDILLRLFKIEKKVSKHDDDFKVVFAYLKKLLSPSHQPMRKIGFKHLKED